MKGKRSIAVILVLIMVVALTLPTAAANPPDQSQPGILMANGLTYHNEETEQAAVNSRAAIAPYWSYTSYIVHGIDIGSGGRSSVDVLVRAYSTSYRISGTVTLQRSNGTSWTTEDSWSISGTGSASLSEPYTVSPGRYRVKTAVNVNGESITVYSTIKTYG